jgi:hypothetical protein
MPYQKDEPAAQSGNNRLRKNRAYSAATINRAFNDFLQLGNLDRKILAHYQDALHQGSELFAKTFYDYLLASPVTVQVLERFRARGGKIEDLVKRQSQHLWDLLSGRTDDMNPPEGWRISAISTTATASSRYGSWERTCFTSITCKP